MIETILMIAFIVIVLCGCFVASLYAIAAPGVIACLKLFEHGKSELDN